MINTDRPLITLRYELWRVGWRFFFVLAPFFALCFYAILFRVTPYGDTVNWILHVVGGSVLVGVTLMGADMFLTKEYQLFPDRIVKVFRAAGKIEVPLDHVSILVTSYIFGSALVLSIRQAMPLRQRIKLPAMMFDFNLAQKGSVESFRQACTLIGIEL
jgi:hypothetical protein